MVIPLRLLSRFVIREFPLTGNISVSILPVGKIWLSFLVHSQYTLRQVSFAGHRSQVAGHRSQVAGRRSQVAGHRSQVTGHKLQVTAQ